jgi:conjugal transfer mating pair stabilization protein TraN
VILIQLIWTCEEEFALGAKRELRSCHDVGSYCKSKILTACIERRKAYCCFNTPLARILNEQIRPQLGRGGQPGLPGARGRGPRAGGLEPGEPGRVAGHPG